ncbi:MAG TPA: lamin tail domain-containing protein, partial [Gaiellaceae bacterium]
MPVAHDRNGNNIKGTPGQANWISLVTLTPTPTITPISSPSSVVINEVAWAGTSASTADDEWIELYNPGTLPVDITGWHLYGDDNTVNKVGSPNITLKGTIPGGPNGGYFLLEKNEQATTVTADQVYTTGDLLNGGERLYLKNSAGTVID